MPPPDSPVTSRSASSAWAFCMFPASACACFIRLPSPPASSSAPHAMSWPGSIEAASIVAPKRSRSALDVRILFECGAPPGPHGPARDPRCRAGVTAPAGAASNVTRIVPAEISAPAPDEPIFDLLACADRPPRASSCSRTTAPLRRRQRNSARIAAPCRDPGGPNNLRPVAGIDRRRRAARARSGAWRCGAAAPRRRAAAVRCGIALPRRASGRNASMRSSVIANPARVRRQRKSRRPSQRDLVVKLHVLRRHRPAPAGPRPASATSGSACAASGTPCATPRAAGTRPVRRAARRSPARPRPVRE